MSYAGPPRHGLVHFEWKCSSHPEKLPYIFIPLPIKMAMITRILAAIVSVCLHYYWQRCTMKRIMTTDSFQFKGVVLLIFSDKLGFIPGAFQVARLPMQETRIPSLSREDPLEQEMATHFSVLAWEIPWTEKPGGLQSMSVQRVGHNRGLHSHCQFHIRLWHAMCFP